MYPPSPNILARYVADTATHRERVLVEEWRDRSVEHRRFLEEIEQVYELSGRSREVFDESDVLETSWRALLVRMDRAGEESDRFGGSTPGTGNRARESGLMQTLRVAAVLLVFLGGAALLARIYDGTADLKRGLEGQMFVTAPGERTQIQLEDGTHVVLGVASRLSVPSRLDGPSRTIHLQGEAYFDVAPRSDRPFVIRTADAEVTVRGTEFDLSAYPGDRLHVAVLEGEVALSDRTSPSASSVLVGAGEVGIRTASGDPIAVRPADLNAYTGWLENRLVFDRATLTEVVRRLERWYAVEVEVPGELESLRLTADLEARSLRSVLEVISASLGIRYGVRGDRVQFYSDA